MRLYSILMIGSLFAMNCLTPVTGQDRKPNVILIYSDDQGTLDANCYGAEDLATPNIDRLARSGVRFTQFYANSVCSPSRAALLTGKTSQRAGVPTNVGGEKGLPPEEYSMAEMFRDAGYATALVGKWHLGEIPGKKPNDQGFDYFFGFLKGCIDNYSHFFYWRGPNLHNLYRNYEEIYRPGEYFPEMMLEESKHFITHHKDEPFFLYLAFNTPHYPYQGTTEWLAHYREKGTDYPRDLYAGFVSTMDEYIGELLTFIDDQEMTENTIIIFQSDNGHSTEERAHFGGGYTGIYRGAKACLFEGGIRVPAIISWPEEIPEGEVRDQMAVNVDWMPTLAELCGIGLDTRDLDGKSLTGIITDPDAPSRHETSGYYWEKARSWAVRKGKWKLHGNPLDSGIPSRPYLGVDHFLVNLEEDPAEQVNLADQYPEVVSELSEEYRRWKESEKQ